MTDTEILDGLRAGDARAAGEMFDRYGDRLLRSATLLCGDRDMARDLAQETLLRAVRSATRCRGTSALYTWLHGILLNVTRQMRRRAWRLRYTDALPETAADSARSALTLDDETLAASLARALGQLSARHREAVVLRYYEGMSLAEIAVCAGVGVGTVKSRLFHAIRRLQRLVPEELNLLLTKDTNG
jgi:RNA polymerase sigma-70 factor, ECF subfamily